MSGLRKAVDVSRLRDEILGGDNADTDFFDYAVGAFVELSYHEAKQR